MTPSDEAFRAMRHRMVDAQVSARGVRDPRVLAAMRLVPRHVFVPDEQRAHAYEDRALPIEAGQTISQPYIVGLMAAALELRPDDRVLEVGAGSGYAAAVLSQLAAQVYAVERRAELVELARRRIVELDYDNVHIKLADGTLGWPERAPFDAISVAAGGPRIAESLVSQLAVGGRLVMPVGGSPHDQQLVRVRRVSENEYEREELGSVHFVPLIGQEGWPRPDPGGDGSGPGG